MGQKRAIRQCCRPAGLGWKDEAGVESKVDLGARGARAWFFPTRSRTATCPRAVKLLSRICSCSRSLTATTVNWKLLGRRKGARGGAGDSRNRVQTARRGSDWAFLACKRPLQRRGSGQKQFFVVVARALHGSIPCCNGRQQIVACLGGPPWKERDSQPQHQRQNEHLALPPLIASPTTLLPRAHSSLLPPAVCSSCHCRD